MNNIDKWLKDMSDKELASTTHSWIECAVQQKNKKLTVSLAHSASLTYSDWDRILLQRQTLN